MDVVGGLHMKIFIVSDIHGSFEAIKKVLNHYQSANADQIILLGDVLYHGPRNPLPKGHDPKKVAELLNEFKAEIIAIRGNCDSEVDQMVLQFPMMAQYSVLLDRKRKLFFSHGHLYSEENLPPLKAGDAFIYGHTHIAKAQTFNGVNILNPGSISLPKGEIPATFAIYEEGVFMLYDLDFHLIDRFELK